MPSSAATVGRRGVGAPGPEHLQDLDERALLVDDGVPPGGAEGHEAGVEPGIVDRAGDDADRPEQPAVGEPVDLPVADVAGGHDRALARGHRPLHVLAAFHVHEAQHLLAGPALEPEDVHEALPEVAVARGGGAEDTGLGPVREGAAQVIGRYREVPAVGVAPEPAEGAAGGERRAPRQEARDRGEGGDRPLHEPAHAALRATDRSRSRRRSSPSIAAATARTRTGSVAASAGKRTASLAVVTSAVAPAARARSSAARTSSD